jgi:ankyrin repeat protein
VQELAEVLAVDFNAAGGIPKLNEDWRWKDQEQAVLTACSSLIEVVNLRGSNMVQFSHFSVKEFLASNRLATAKFDILRYHHILLEPAHTIMAQACIGVLLRLAEPINETMKMFPLADYAAGNFADHAEFGNVVSQITKGIDELLNEDKPHFAAWMSHISSSWWAEKYSGLCDASPLYHIADLGFCGLVQHLVLKRPQNVIVRRGIHGTPMHAALRRRHVQVCELLLPYVDLDIRDSNGQMPLHVAVGNGLLEVVQLIIGQGANINAQDNNGWTPLHQIINTSPEFNDENLDIMRVLLDNSADVEASDNDHTTPLCQAARNGQLAAAQLLVEHSAMVGRKDRSGSTPLHYASSGGSPDIIRLLLEHGADIQVSNYNRNTPLHLAALRGGLAATQLLVECGAIIHARGWNGGTPLHHASLGGHPDIIRLLLDRRADSDAQDDSYDTPLHMAVDKDHLEATRLLLAHGANVLAQNKTRRTPLQLALAKGNQEIIDLFSAYVGGSRSGRM